MSKQTCSASDESDEEQAIATFENSAGKATHLLKKKINKTKQNKNKGNTAIVAIDKHHAHKLSGNYLQERDFNNVILYLPDLLKTSPEEEDGFGMTQST